MQIFSRSDKKTYNIVRSRLRRVTGYQAQEWAESTLWSVQAGLETRNRDGLLESRNSTVALLAALDILLDRKG